MKRVNRIFILALVVMTMLALGSLAAAQEEVVIIIGWEQEVDAPPIIGSSAFAAYMDEFYGRDVWDWDTDRNIYPVMVEEVPTVENGLVTSVEVMFDDDNNPDTPDVAGQAPIVTYRLRPGMLWSDGEAVTTEDCEFYHNLMFQPDPVDSITGPRAVYVDTVDRVEVVDELTIIQHFKKPIAEFPIDAPLLCGYPAHKFLGDNAEGFTMDADGDGVFDANFDDSPYARSFREDVNELVGYGPYVLTEYNPGESYIFERSANWGANEWETVPAIDTVVLQIIVESAQMQNALEVGDIDMAFNFEPVAQPAYNDMENVEVFSTESVFVDALWFNSGPFAFPAMQDVRVREALVHAIDRRAIANTFVEAGAGDRIPRSWYPVQFTNPDLPFREYDFARAQELLTAAGWVDDDGDEVGLDEEGNPVAASPRVSQGATLPDGTAVPDGQQLVLRFYTTPVIPRPDVQIAAQAYLRAVGVQTQVFVVPGGSVLFAPFNSRGILYTGDYDIAMYALSNTPISLNGSPNNFQCEGIPGPENTNGNNNTWFCDPEYDRLDDLIVYTLDPEERLTLSYERDTLMFNAAVWHGIRPRTTGYAVRTDRWNAESMYRVGTLSGNYFQNVEDWQPAG
jgi:peptide/nickel transport system substrate-binding protein